MKQMTKKLIAGVVLAGLITTTSSEAMFSPKLAPKSGVLTMVKIGVPLAFLALAGFVAFYFINWLKDTKKIAEEGKNTLKGVEKEVKATMQPIQKGKEIVGNVGSAIWNGLGTAGNGLKHVGSKVGNIFGNTYNWVKSFVVNNDETTTTQQNNNHGIELV